MDDSFAMQLCSRLNHRPSFAVDPRLCRIRFDLRAVSAWRDGQTETIKSGFYPITDPVRNEALQVLGIPSDSD
jgi:hypothetical protein